MPRQIDPTPLVIHPPDDLVQQQPGLRRLSHALSLKYAGRQVVSEEDLQVMGGALWAALDLQAEFDAAQARAGAAVLPVIIESQAADVQALPWETLAHPALGFIGKHPGFTLSRRIRPAQAGALPLEKGPLRVLLFTCLPGDVDPETGRLNVEEEQAQVQEALLPWISQGQVRLEMPDDGRFATLQDWLQQYHPHVLFLSGHGRFHHQPHSGEAPYGEFFFEDEAGDAVGVRESEIAGALVGMGVQAVVLSACESSKAASEALANGLAQRLSAQGLPHVIGMRESVLDQAGIQFARALCDELARGERIDAALQAARIAIQTPLKGIARREAGPAAMEELSLGQWCLPMLLSGSPQLQLIDWDFPPQAVEAAGFKQALSTVSLPARFIGRRAEMRRYKSDLLNGRLHKLLITGPGGQGKTALAGKLALDLQAHGCRVFAWSARPENPWGEFELELELALDEARAKKYDRLRAHLPGAAERAAWLMRFLAEQFPHGLALFFDNLESLQDPHTLALQDALIAAWVQAAQAAPGLILLVTSRWKLPGWEHAQLLLERAGLGDFLQMAQELDRRGRVSKSVLQGRGRLRRVYEVLGGNSRGLEYFAAATLGMQGAGEEEAFLEALARTQSELQADMAIAAIYEHLPEPAKMLLRRLPAYHEAVPVEGLVRLGLDLPEPERLVERLLAVSLLEAQDEARWEALEYQCPALVRDWLEQQALVDAQPAWREAAAGYHLYLLQNERPTLAQAVTTHHALRRAGRQAAADRLALDRIVGPLTLAGFFTTLLSEWLPEICRSEDLQTRGEALGQTGKLLHHVGDYETALTYLKQSLAIMQQIGDKAGEGATLNNISQIYDAQGDYETALTYLKQSLAIRQQIGDKAGLCATLFNMGHIHLQNDQVEEAVGAWVTVYRIAKQMHLAQALQALADLAPRLGLPEGLEGWEMLGRRMQPAAGEAVPAAQASELAQVEQMVQAVYQAVSQNSPDAPRLFEAMSRLASSSQAPPPYRALGSVLRQYMSGAGSLDLSGLPEDFARIVRKILPAAP